MGNSELDENSLNESLYLPNVEYSEKTFTISKEQMYRLNKWKDAIKTIHGQYGMFEYIFKPDGIGVGLEVVSKLANNSIDLTEIEKY